MELNCYLFIDQCMNTLHYNSVEGALNHED